MRLIVESSTRLLLLSKVTQYDAATCDKNEDTQQNKQHDAECRMRLDFSLL